MKKILPYLLIFLFTVISITDISAKNEAIVYVSVSGSNDASGLSPEQAVGTLGRAVEIMRTLKTEGQTGVIYIKGGIYRMSDPVTLMEEDSNLTITSYDNNPVEIYGSVALSTENFTTVTDRNVLCRMPKEVWNKVKRTEITDLELISYPDENMPFDGETGYYELYSGEKRQTLARWPNNTNDVVTDVQDARILTVANSDRAKRWINAEKPILQGFLGTGFYHRCNVSAEYIYPETGQIKLSRLPFYAAQPNKEYFVYNLIEELDAPGEWFVENANGKAMLYYYPSGDDELEFSVNTGGGIVINGASDITLENIDFSYFAASAVSIENSENITVKNCDVTHMSRNAAVVKDSKNCTIEDCEFADLGGSGVLLSGGNKVILEHGNNRVSDCLIHSAGYTYCASQPTGVYVQGCGNSVENSDFFDLLNGAIRVEGSLNTVSGNEIHNVITHQSDAGAIYIGHGLLTFKNTIEGNYIHDVRDDDSACIAIYLDDCSHGTAVLGNIIENVGMGMFCGGGRNNTLQYNVMIDESIFYDVRGLANGWAHHVWDVNGTYDGTLLELEANSDYNEEKIISVYPDFKKIVDDIRKRREDNSYDSGIPKNVVITDNVSINAEEKAEAFSTPYMLNGGLIKRYGNADESNNFGISREGAGFVNEAGKDYTITDNSPILAALPGFKRTAFSEIGAKNGEYKEVLQLDTLSDSVNTSMVNIEEIKPQYGAKGVNTSENIEITLLEPKESYELNIYAGNTKLNEDAYTVTTDGVNMVIDFKENMLPECIYQVELDEAFTYFKTGRYSLERVIEYDFDNAVPQIDVVAAATGTTAGIVTDEISGSKALEISFSEGKGEYDVLVDSEVLEYDHVIVKYKLRVDGYGYNNDSKSWGVFCRKMPQFTSDDGKSAAMFKSAGNYLKLHTAEEILDIYPELKSEYINKYVCFETELNYAEKTISGQKDLLDDAFGKVGGGFENTEAQNLYSLRFKGEDGCNLTVWIDDLVIGCYNLSNK